MNRLESFCVCTLISCAVPMFVGCGPSEMPKKKPYPTRGTLRMNGEPVRFASIYLSPADPLAGEESDGSTDENGEFSLRTYSNGEPDGVIPGTYKVTIGAYNATGKPPLPDGVKPTAVKTPLELEQTVQIGAEDNDLTIDIP